MIKLLDFYADWCGPCKIMKPVFESVEKEYKDKIEFQKVDVEIDGTLTEAYGIMSIPTFVIEKDKVELDRKQGAMPLEVFKSWIDSHIS
ncbi:thioredoxin fold domain-containing protein [Patescibacteria group bacterium]|nr:thioredoxin fold domain-containing protein [Patescibacteria group bacterium]